MGHKVLTIAQQDKYMFWRSQGISTKEASERVGISERTGKRWNAVMRGGERRPNQNSLPSTINSRRTGTGFSSNRAPDPQDIMDLSDSSKRALEDITVFGKTFFAIDLVPWQVKAAKISVEAIADRSERHFGIANEPPGVGKSTLWTFIIPTWLLCGGGTMDPGWWGRTEMVAPMPDAI